MADGLVYAPWTEDEVVALNAFQRSGRMHPFTCGGEHPLHQTLIAERDGWHCPDEECSYTQDWAHAFMADSLMLEMLPERPTDPSMLPSETNPRALVRSLCQKVIEGQKQLAAERQRTEALRGELRRRNATREFTGRPLVSEREATKDDAVWASGAHAPEQQKEE